eukprot:SAG31_NODE_2378_length_5838_cov_11.939362_1_plen_1456_part_01
MMNILCIVSALLAGAMALPLQSVEYTLSIDLTTSAEFTGLESALVEHNPFEHTMTATASTTRRHLQTGAATSLTVNYRIQCANACADVSDSIAALTDSELGATYASNMIAAINAAAVSSGFSSAVVVSTPEEVASTIVVPDTVVITLPAPEPAPEPVDPCENAFLCNGELSGPVSDNTIPGWSSVSATISIVDMDGRSGVVEIADAGSFSSLYQTLTTVPGQRYLFTFDVWAEPLHNTAGQAYCSSTDSNGLLDIHDGPENSDNVLRHGEVRVCPLEDQPGTWQTVEGLYTAESDTTTIALHSESGWAAYFDSITVEVRDDDPAFTYLGCWVDNTNGERDVDLDDNSFVLSSVSTTVAQAELECALACDGYLYFGLQWVHECFCGNRYGSQGEADAADCGGDPQTLCSNGAEDCGNRNAVYALGDVGSGEPIEVRECEGDTLSIACDGGTINVVEASYGRQHGPDVCPHSATSDQSCHAENSLNIVQDACQGQASCEVAVTNGVFGDPCGGTYKYLTVNYVCETGELYCEADANDYRGTIATTITGRTCQYWAAQTPHGHSRTPNNYPEFGLDGEHNYCRNPDGEPTAWCYTIDPASRWELCEVGEPQESGSAACPVVPADPNDPCDLDADGFGTVVDNGGEVDYDDGHSNGEDCRWTLTCSAGTPILTFVNFNTESNYDFVNVYDGDSVDADRVGRLHGTSLPDPITASGSIMVVQFTSDGSVTQDGFLAAVTCGSGGIEWESYDAATADSNAPVDTSHVGHFGAGFIDFTTADGQYITFAVTVPAEAEYLMQVGYTLASTDRPLQLSVNDAVVDAAAQDGYDDDGLIHFPRSDSWTDYRLTQAIPVSLNAGENTVTLTTVGSSGANIDGIYIATGEAGGHPLDGGGAADCPNVASYTQFKFNLDPAGDFTGLRDWGAANSIQLAEVTLYAADQSWIQGATATNPGGNNPGGEPPSAAVNGYTDPVTCPANCNHKWLDFNKGDLVLTFGAAVEVASYDWMTANDAPERDPTKWTLEGSNDGASWTVVDDQFADGFDTTTDRYMFQGPFCISGSPPADPVYCLANAADYRGTVATSVTGRTCQDWAAQTPHSHSRTHNNYPEFGLDGEHNYCRNPDGEATAWCYTTDPGSRWELCDVGAPNSDGSCPPPPPPPPPFTQEYFCTATEADYRGTIATTITGNTCQAWAEQTPHEHTRTHNNYPEYGLAGEHNYCRNPDGWTNTWCYTTDPAIRWENCDIGPAHDCDVYCEADASDYVGLVAETITGRTCQMWAAQTPHSHTRTPNNYPEFGLEGEHNYCRNPDGEPTAWCYTTDPGTRWELCDVGDVTDCERFCESTASDYRGTIATTVGGYECMFWAAQSPHEHTRTPHNYPEFGLTGEHNYCRNPDGWTNTWCYTTDPAQRWDNCDVGAAASDCDVATPPPPPDDPVYCLANAADYRGTVATSVTGRTCQDWAAQT